MLPLLWLCKSILLMYEDTVHIRSGRMFDIKRADWAILVHYIINNYYIEERTAE